MRLCFVSIICLCFLLNLPNTRNNHSQMGNESQCKLLLDECALLICVIFPSCMFIFGRFYLLIHPLFRYLFIYLFESVLMSFYRQHIIHYSVVLKYYSMLFAIICHLHVNKINNIQMCVVKIHSLSTDK